MGTNVILLGDLRFPPRALRTWLKTEVDVGAFDDWLDEYRAAAARTTPRALLKTLAKPEIAIGDQEVTGNAVTLKLLLGEDEYRDLCAPLAAAFRSAAKQGGSGELTAVEWEGAYAHRVVVSPEGSSLRRVRGKALAELAARPEVLELAGRPRTTESAAEKAAREIWSQPTRAVEPPPKKRLRRKAGAPEVDGSGMLDAGRIGATIEELVTTAPTAAYDALSPMIEALFRKGPKSKAAGEHLRIVLESLQAQACQMRKSKRVPPILRADPRWIDLGLRALEAHVFGTASSIPIVSVLRALAEVSDPRVVPALASKLPAAKWELREVCNALRQLSDGTSVAALEGELLVRSGDRQDRELLGFTIEEIRAVVKRRERAANKR